MGGRGGPCQRTGSYDLHIHRASEVVPQGSFLTGVALLRLAIQALKPLHCIMFSTFLLECQYGLSQEVMRSMSLEVCKQGPWP